MTIYRALLESTASEHGARMTAMRNASENAGELIVVTLKDGPFRELHGEWAFRRLRDDACKVGFDLTYEFSSGLLDKVIGPVFNHIATTFIDAFVKRAEVVYGEPR